MLSHVPNLTTSVRYDYQTVEFLRGVAGSSRGFGTDRACFSAGIVVVLAKLLQEERLTGDGISALLATSCGQARK